MSQTYTNFFYSGRHEHGGLAYAAERGPVAGAEPGPDRVSDRVHLRHGGHPHRADWASWPGAPHQLQVIQMSE